MKKGGMPAGHKTKKVLIREEVEKKSTDIAVNFFLDMVAEKGPQVIKKIFDQAIDEGCRTSQKLIMDRFAPAAKAVDANANSGDFNIQVNIGKLQHEDENGQTITIEGNENRH